MEKDQMVTCGWMQRSWRSARLWMYGWREEGSRRTSQKNNKNNDSWSKYPPEHTSVQSGEGCNYVTPQHTILIPSHVPASPHIPVSSTTKSPLNHFQQAKPPERTLTLCKKESQLQSKKMDFSQEKSRKSQKKVKKIDFSLTFLDWNPFFLTVTDFLFYRD